MSDSGFDVEGPVQAEVFVLWLDRDALALTGPCGPDPWLIEVAGHEDPFAVVTAMATRLMGAPRVVHSTSWRRDRGAVILSFVVVIDATAVSEMESAPVTRIDLARGGATDAPGEILTGQVLEHGLRHLAWLIRDDPAVTDALSDGWPEALSPYKPEPFRHLG